MDAARNQTNSVVSLGTILESCFVIKLKMTYSDLINLMWSVGMLELKVIVFCNQQQALLCDIFAGECLNNRSDKMLIHAMVRD